MWAYPVAEGNRRSIQFTQFLYFAIRIMYSGGLTRGLRGALPGPPDLGGPQMSAFLWSKLDLKNVLRTWNYV